MTLFGDRPVEHDLIALHLADEFPRTRPGNSVNIWTRRPEAENHLLDCVVGAAVGGVTRRADASASIGGSIPKDQTRKRISFSELQKARSGGRR